jgi:hypothetical protein
MDGTYRRSNDQSIDRSIDRSAGGLLKPFAAAAPVFVFVFVLVPASPVLVARD